MSHNYVNYPLEKEALYPLILTQLQALTEGGPYLIDNLANASALLNEALPDINWVGFYLVEGGKLVLGPFQGKTACIEIPCGRGVCGAAMARDEVMLVPDVHAFPGHIACDSASNSEIVVPLRKDGQVVAVLDIDSPTKGRFTEEDAQGLARVGQLLEKLF